MVSKGCSTNLHTMPDTCTHVGGADERQQGRAPKSHIEGSRAAGVRTVPVNSVRAMEKDFSSECDISAEIASCV
jgi:hypothetical protein